MSEGAVEPRVVDVRTVPVLDADLSAAVEHLRAGGIAAYPTETVYGLGGPCTPAAVAELSRLKRRERSRPFLVLVGDATWVDALGWTPSARELAEVFWPGAVTLVLPDPRGMFPPGVRSESGSVAVRWSPNPLVRRLLEGVGEPITSSSANLPGEPPARSGDEAVEVVRRMDALASVIVVQAGTLPPSEPSTLIDCTGTEPVVLRQGSVPVARLRCVLPEIHEADPA